MAGTDTFADIEGDTGSDDPTAWPPCTEPGEAGCPCEDNADCYSGWCVDHLGDDVCTEACDNDCPPGWSCTAVSGGADGLTFICISDHANLCRPCTAAGGCLGSSGEEAACVGYGPGGSFCGSSCDEDLDCPEGYHCDLEAATVAGAPTAQCVHDGGECPCSAKAIELALHTDCSTTTDQGTCEGIRVCSPEGLSDCSAPLATVEVCDDVDDDCDGDTEQGDCADSNVCTTEVCLGAAGCESTPLTGTPCDDATACTELDHCEVGICVGEWLDCDDDNPCTDDDCEVDAGCVQTANASPCDDGDPCTVADTCAQQACGGTPIACACEIDTDCASLDDGDTCTGELVCDTSQLPYVCAVDPVTVVECPEPSGQDAPCLAAACDPDTGACSLVAANEGGGCDDGDACTQTDTCVAGGCSGGEPVVCVALDQCHEAGVCAPATGLCSDPAKSDDAPCDDGDACTQTDGCEAGVCAGTDPVACVALDQCHEAGVCAPETGLCSDPAKSDDAPCDDGDACTQTDGCQAGVCAGSDPVVCVAVDQCHEAGVCAPETGLCSDPAKSDDAPCDDGDACTQTDSCQAGVCDGAAPVVCDALDQCHDAGVCAPETGQCSTPPKSDNAACDDGDACTATDTCQAGVCDGASPVVCSALDQCHEAGVCAPETGQCSNPASSDDTPCNDDDACTHTDTCQAGVCEGAAPVVCTALDQCHDVGTCAPETGQCSNPAKGDGASCDDDDACTTTDTCQAGVCDGASPVICSALDQCHDVGTCAPETGQCSNPAKSNNTDCDDDDACTQTDTCQAGICSGTNPLDCDDGDDCTGTDCSAATGCTYPPVECDVPCGPWGDLDAGFRGSGGVAADGTLWTWGYNNRGVLGDGQLPLSGSAPTPVQISTATDWVKIVIANGNSSGHGMALKSNGDLYVWGRNNYGQLGIGSADDGDHPTPIKLSGKWKTMDAGDNFTLAVNTSGQLYAWGRNQFSQLGNTQGDKSSPTLIQSSTDWFALNGGYAHSLGIRGGGTSGSLYGWGSNAYGEQGNGASCTNGVGYPSPVTSPTKGPGPTDWVAMASGQIFSIAQRSNGSLWGFGNNQDGKLGSSDSDWTPNSCDYTFSTPRAVVGGTAWVIGGFAVGRRHSIAVKSNGTLWAWGKGGNYVGGGGDKFVPTQIGSDTDWTAPVAAGDGHSLASKTDGTLWAFGDNTLGELGTGGGSTATPVEVVCPSEP